MGGGQSTLGKVTQCTKCQSSSEDTASGETASGGNYMTMTCGHTLCPTCYNGVDIIASQHAKLNSEPKSQSPTSSKEDEVDGETNLAAAATTFSALCPICNQVQEVPNLKKAFQLFGAQDEHCPKHKAYPLKLHCLECCLAICYECYTTEHDGHSRETINDAMRELQPKLLQHLKSLESEHQPHQHQLNQVTETMETLTQKYEDVMRAAEADTEAKVTTLRQNLDLFKDKVTNQRESELRDLESRKSELQMTIASMDNLLPWKQIPVPTESPGSKVFCKLQGEIFPRVLQLTTKLERFTRRRDEEMDSQVGYPEFQASSLDLSTSAGQVTMVYK